MNKTPDGTDQKVSAVSIEPALDQYRNKVLFPDKLAKANKMLKTAKLPAKRQHD